MISPHPTPPVRTGRTDGRDKRQDREWDGIRIGIPFPSLPLSHTSFHLTLPTPHPQSQIRSSHRSTIRQVDHSSPDQSLIFIFPSLVSPNFLHLWSGIGGKELKKNQIIIIIISYHRIETLSPHLLYPIISSNRSIIFIQQQHENKIIIQINSFISQLILIIFFLFPSSGLLTISPYLSYTGFSLGQVWFSLVWDLVQLDLT